MSVKDLTKKTKLLISVIFIFTLIMVIGITYAYFSAASIIGNSSANSIVLTTANRGELLVEYLNGNATISMNQIDLKESEKNSRVTSLLKFSIDSSSEVTENVRIYWKDVTNTFCQYENNGACTNNIDDTYVGDEINYSTYECSAAVYQNVRASNINEECEVIGTPDLAAPLSGDMANVSGTNNIEITSGKKYYVLALTIENKLNVQDYNQGKTFNGRIYVEMYSNEGTTIEGLVVNELNEAQSGKTVTLHSEPRTTVTDENGYYKFENVAYGSHRVVVDEIEKAVTLLRATETSVLPTGIRIHGGSIAVNIELKTNEIELKEPAKVTINVPNGTVDKTSQYYIGTDLTYAITANEGYSTVGSTIECNNGISSEANNNVVTITEAIANGGCLVNLKPVISNLALETEDSTIRAQITVNDTSKIDSYHYAYTSSNSCEGLEYVSIAELTKEFEGLSDGEYKVCAYVTDKLNIQGIIASEVITVDTVITYEKISSSYNCANASAGSSPYLMTYSGNCSLINDTSGNYRIRLTSSGTLKFLKEIYIDAFLVGGGGGGASGSSGYSCAGGGGGGGRTATFTNITILANGESDVTIGAGGTGTSGNGSAALIAGSGGPSILTVSGSTYKALGGGGGYCSRSSSTPGGSGGSGGGGGGSSSPGRGGSYGASGTAGYSPAGSGQKSTTCEFGQGTTSGCNSGVPSYSGGGSGGAYGGRYPGFPGGAIGGVTDKSTTRTYTMGPGAENTGGGGGGGYAASSYMIGGCNGGTGIVVIRNVRS